MLTAPAQRLEGRPRWVSACSELSRKRTVPWALAIVAAVLRFHRLEPEFRSSDAALAAAKALKAMCSSASFPERLHDLVFFKLGAVQPLLLYAHAWLVDAVGGTLDATTWTVSGVLVSAVSVWCAYWFMRDLFGPTAGVLSALLLTFSPAHTFTGRSLAAPWAHEVTLQLALLLTTSRHFRHPTAALGALFYVLLAVYLWSGNQVLGIAPVLGYALLTAYLRRTHGQSIAAFLRQRLLSPGLLVFAAAGIALWFATWEAHRGHLYHALFEKKKVLGWYVSGWCADLVHNFGYVPAGAALVSLIVLPLCVRRVFDWRLLPLVYCLCYSAPFWFFISRKTTQTFTQGYTIYGMTGLLLVFVAATTFLPWRSVRVGVPAVVSLTLLVGTGASVYRYYPPGLLGVKGFQGSYRSPSGVSAAALFVQQQLPPRRGRVFSDASGGSGLEPPVLYTYFRRPSFALLDRGGNATPYRVFKRKQRQIAYLVTKPQNARLVRKTFPKFHRRATVVSESGNEPLLEVYARDPGAEVTLSARDGIERYDEGFPSLCTRGKTPPKPRAKPNPLRGAR